MILNLGRDMATAAPHFSFRTTSFKNNLDTQAVPSTITSQLIIKQYSRFKIQDYFNNASDYIQFNN